MNPSSLFSPDESLRRQVQQHLTAQEWGPSWEALQVLAALHPRDAWVQQWRVVVALALGKPQQAQEAAQAALGALPAEARQERADVLANLGQAHGLLGQAASSLVAFDEALSLQPQHAQALLGRAKALAQLGHHGEAGKAVTLAVQADPHNLEALALLGNTLVKAHAPDHALAAFARHERLKPAAPFVACMLVFLRRQLAEWTSLGLPVNGTESEYLKQTLARGEVPELALLAHRAWQNMPAVEPFAGLVLYDDPALQRHAAEQFLKHMHPPVPLPAAPSLSAASLLLQDTQRQPGPLRVAYVSSEFNAHATSYLLAGVLEQHCRKAVEVFLLSFAPPPASGQPDAMQQRLAAAGHTWVDVHRWPDAQVAQWCRAQHIDVAVDLKGLTRDSRPGIFAHRAAPVQVNWLGYPGSMPAPYYDWVLADAQVLPPELEPHFGERVWRLPHSYQPTDNTRPRVVPVPGARAAHGLPERGVVLCSFNNSFKFTPATWALWMRLLQAVPGSVLWLLQGHPRTQANLRAAATAAGVDAARLVFAPSLPQAEHLARLALADLSLETWPYNAHTTASDALWAGVPHLTCPGKSFASRVGASLVTALGMADELLAADLADYEARVLHLMREPSALAALRAKVQVQRAVAPLFDTARFTRDLEEALYGMTQAGPLQG